MQKKLNRAKLRLSRIKKNINTALGDKRKLDAAKDIRSILTDKEYNLWIKKLSKGASPDEQKKITREYAREIGKYDEWNSIARLD